VCKAAQASACAASPEDSAMRRYGTKINQKQSLLTFVPAAMQAHPRHGRTQTRGAGRDGLAGYQATARQAKPRASPRALTLAGAWPEHHALVQGQHPETPQGSQQLTLQHGAGVSRYPVNGSSSPSAGSHNWPSTASEMNDTGPYSAMHRAGQALAEQAQTTTHQWVAGRRWGSPALPFF
jgi:hypothetical protein